MYDIKRKLHMLVFNFVSTLQCTHVYNFSVQLNKTFLTESFLQNTCDFKFKKLHSTKKLITASLF